MEGAVEEEMMALESIFYDSFSKIDDNRFRVRIDPSTEADEAEDPQNSIPPLFVELILPAEYPDKIPQFDISNINNRSYSDYAKKAIMSGLTEQASSLIGESMCYTILEWLKDKLPEFHSMKLASTIEDTENLDSNAYDANKASNGAKKDVKEKLTKAQKRRYFDRFGAANEKPRGWNWVNIISHLNQVPQHGS